MNARILQRALGFMLLAAPLAATGCELVADFDRSQIPGNDIDSGVRPMQPLPDAGTGDASTSDAGDAGEDDAGRDGEDDAGR